MSKTVARPAAGRPIARLVAAGVALAVAQTPAVAGGAITNFKIKNCARERIFVCSFDKTDSLMKVPYKAKGIKPGDKKELGCASLKKCKVIIGVSKKRSKSTLSRGMKAALASGAVVAASVAGGSTAAAAGTAAGIAAVAAETASPLATAAAGASTVATLTTVGASAAVVAVAAGGAVAALEIKDGWSDGEICNQVKKAARKLGLKPKHFLKNGKKYTVVEQYVLDKNGNALVNPDGTAVFAYATKTSTFCPRPLQEQLIPN